MSERPLITAFGSQVAYSLIERGCRLIRAGYVINHFEYTLDASNFLGESTGKHFGQVECFTARVEPAECAKGLEVPDRNLVSTKCLKTASLLCEIGSSRSRISLDRDEFTYWIDAASILPNRGSDLPGSEVPANNVTEGVGVVSVVIPSDSGNPEKDATSGNESFCVGVADALPEQRHSGNNFQGFLRLNVDGLLHDGSVIKFSVEGQAL